MGPPPGRLTTFLIRLRSAKVRAPIVSKLPCSIAGGSIGVPDRTRTCDPQFRKLLLYPTELRGRRQTAYSYGGPFASSVTWLWPELRWAGEHTRSNSVPDCRGLNVSADCTTMDLAEKRLDHRERPQRRTVVALTRLMLLEERPNRRHIEQA
jgi:hypothetical protein